MMQHLVVLSNTNQSRILVNVKRRQRISDWNIAGIGIQMNLVRFVTIVGGCPDAEGGQTTRVDNTHGDQARWICELIAT